MKRSLLQFLLQSQCCAAAIEVRCPASRFRADIAGYAEPSELLPTAIAILPRPLSAPTTVLIECKQARADLLRDIRSRDALLARRRDLDRRRAELEDRIIKPSEPHLRRTGEMLFQELEAWDFALSRVPSYRLLIRDLRRLDLAIYGQTKFWLMRRYAVADHLYVAAAPGLLSTDELPIGWGLIECDPDDPDAVAPRIRVPAPPLGSRHQARLLRNIAVAASFASRHLPRHEPDPAERNRAAPTERPCEQCCESSSAELNDDVRAQAPAVSPTA